MLEIYLGLLPVFAWFFLGVITRYLGWVKESHGAKLLKFMFFVTLPVLVFVKITEASIALTQFYLPLVNIIINLVCLGIMILLTRGRGIERPVLGVMLVSSSIINNFFTFPFIHSVLGDEALANAIVFDLGNAITTLSVAYVIAFTYGPEELRLKDMLFNVAKLPALWAIALAFLFNFMSIRLPVSWLNILAPFGLLTNIFILVSLGIYFNLKMSFPGLALMTVATRMIGGLAVAIACAWVFKLEGIPAVVVILCGAAPIGFNGLTYSSLARLDMPFASSTVSASIFCGLFTIPALLYILQKIYL